MSIRTCFPLSIERTRRFRKCWWPLKWMRAFGWAMWKCSTKNGNAASDYLRNAIGDVLNEKYMLTATVRQALTQAFSVHFTPLSSSNGIPRKWYIYLGRLARTLPPHRSGLEYSRPAHRPRLSGWRWRMYSRELILDKRLKSLNFRSKIS